MSSRWLGIAIALTALSACGSSSSQPPSEPSASEPSASEPSTTPLTTTQPTTRGIPAKPVATDVAFSLNVTPSSAKPGAIVTATFVGDVSGQWAAGALALIDEQTAGEWRSIWALIDTEIPTPPQSLAAPNSEYMFPAIGYPPDKPLMFELPDELEAGTYRLCRELVEPSPSTRTAYLCAPLSIVS